jgi:alpha-tubulin suppressor-like RCC1 family protein
LRWGNDPASAWGHWDDPHLFSLRPIVVEGFGGVCLRRVCASQFIAFAIGEDGEVFSWGSENISRLGHGDGQIQPSPKRVEALRGVRVSSISVGMHHALG